jgi:RecG-like helicase
MKLFGRTSPTPDPAASSLPPVTPIAEVTPREPARVRGTVVRLRAIPRTGLPSLAATVEDDTGRVVAIWVGRRSIGGVTLGRTIDLYGTLVQAQHDLEMHNPEYTLRR